MRHGVRAPPADREFFVPVAPCRSRLPVRHFAESTRSVRLRRASVGVGAGAAVGMAVLVGAQASSAPDDLSAAATHATAPAVSASVVEPTVAPPEREARLSRASDRPELDVPRAPSLDSRERASLVRAPGRVGGQRGKDDVNPSRAGVNDVDDVDVSYADPRDIARGMLGSYGWSSVEFSCLDELWTGESDWLTHADNPTSSAYGIPQALPGEKMASAGPDWATNPATQIEWGLGYIADSYGTPCSANAFKLANGWY